VNKQQEGVEKFLLSLKIISVWLDSQGQMKGALIATRTGCLVSVFKFEGKQSGNRSYVGV
jgi:hypothetical protein